MSEFVIITIVFSIVVGLPIGVIIILNSFRKFRIIPLIIIAILIGIILGGMVSCDRSHNEKIWQNGICDCGNNYELFDIEHHKNSSDHYFYKCENCNDLIETTFYFREKG